MRAWSRDGIRIAGTIAGGGTGRVPVAVQEPRLNDGMGLGFAVSPAGADHQFSEHTPMDRFGAPEELIGTMLWLLAPDSAFVTGVVVPVDGGFSAFSGV